MKTTQIIVCVSAISAAIVFFQSCGQVQFESAQQHLATSSNGPDGGGSTTTGEGGNGNTVTPTEPTTLSSDDTTVVECDIGGSSTKVILQGDLAGDSSNSSSTRICMSQNACLSLVNTYVNAHGGTLAAGAATTPTSTGQVTQVFPGSQGTCNNATVLTDAEVNTLLANLGK